MLPAPKVFPRMYSPSCLGALPFFERGVGGVRGSRGCEDRGVEGKGAARLGLREDEGPGEPGRREEEEIGDWR